MLEKLLSPITTALDFFLELWNLVLTVFNFVPPILGILIWAAIIIFVIDFALDFVS